MSMTSRSGIKMEQSVSWHAGGTFTTADPCLNATNVTAITEFWYSD